MDNLGLADDEAMRIVCEGCRQQCRLTLKLLPGSGKVGLRINEGLEYRRGRIYGDIQARTAHKHQAEAVRGFVKNARKCGKG